MRLLLEAASQNICVSTRTSRVVTIQQPVAATENIIVDPNGCEALTLLFIRVDVCRVGRRRCEVQIRLSLCVLGHITHCTAACRGHQHTRHKAQARNRAGTQVPAAGECRSVPPPQEPHNAAHTRLHPVTLCWERFAEQLPTCRDRAQRGVRVMHAVVLPPSCRHAHPPPTAVQVAVHGTQTLCQVQLCEAMAPQQHAGARTEHDDAIGLPLPWRPLLPPRTCVHAEPHQYPRSGMDATCACG